LATTNFTQA